MRRCARIKAKVVAEDEKETRGLRTVLNFGHTVGHAVEAAGRYNQYHHGESVGLGMRVAARISVSMGLLTAASRAAHQSIDYQCRTAGKNYWCAFSQDFGFDASR